MSVGSLLPQSSLSVFKTALVAVWLIVCCSAGHFANASERDFTVAGPNYSEKFILPIADEFVYVDKSDWVVNFAYKSPQGEFEDIATLRFMVTRNMDEKDILWKRDFYLSETKLDKPLDSSVSVAGRCMSGKGNLMYMVEPGKFPLDYYSAVLCKRTLEGNGYNKRILWVYFTFRGTHKSQVQPYFQDVLLTMMSPDFGPAN